MEKSKDNYKDRRFKCNLNCKMWSKKAIIIFILIISVIIIIGIVVPLIMLSSKVLSPTEVSIT